MASRVIKYLSWGAYALVVMVVFVCSGYLAFNRFVRSGVTAVPGLVGREPEEAAAIVREQGLKLRWREGEDRYDERVPAGNVLLQSPPAGSLVKRGSAVEVVGSLGEELLTVPDLQGLALQAAQVTLSSSGLALGQTAGIFASGGVPGTVVEQEPRAGVKIGKTEDVNIYLCLGDPSETYVMPDLVYRGLAEVRGYFQTRNFRLGSIKFETYEGIAPGVVLRQYPLPGHQLRKSDVISLVVTAIESET